MNPDILIPILTLSGIAIGAGLLLRWFDANDKYDERQLVERGKAAGLAMNTAIVYLLGLFAGHAFDLLHAEYMAVFAVWGLVVTMLVHTGYCIFHDAHLTAEQDALPEALKSGALGCVWLALSSMFNYGGDVDWIDLALALDNLGTAAMLVIYALVLRIQDRRTEKEDADE